ncbi:MAG: DinB family protein [Gemmatimonadales bacterium]
MTAPEPWLRGPVAGIPPLLQPAAHAFIMAREDVDKALDGLDQTSIWLTPGGAASIGFHLAHLAGSTDRLLTYARGEGLSDAQRATLLAESALDQTRPPLEQLRANWHTTLDAAARQLAATPEASLLSPREVGRARLPSTVLGLVFHAAEHASRHVGQIVTMARVVRKANTE